MQIAPGWSTRRNVIYNAGVETTKEYLNGSEYSTIHPEIKVQCSPFDPPFIPIEIAGTNLSSIIQSLTFSKNLQNPGGAFSFTTIGNDVGIRQLMQGPLGKLWDKQGMSFERMMRPKTFLEVFLDGYPICNGQVEHCSRAVDTAWNPTYNVSGWELGAMYDQNVLQMQTISYLTSSESHIIAAPNKLFDMLGSTLVGQPMSVAISNMINAYILGTLGGYATIPAVGPLTSDGIPLAIRMLALATPLGAVSNRSYAASVQVNGSLVDSARGQSFWKFLQSLLAVDFVEFFTESGGRTIATGSIGGSFSSTEASVFATDLTKLQPVSATILLPGTNNVVLRSNPYDIPWLNASYLPWASLYPFTMSTLDLIIAGDFVIVTDDVVITKDLGTDSSQQFTVFEASQTGLSMLVSIEDLRRRPVISGGPFIPFFPGGIKTHGVKHLMQRFTHSSQFIGGAAFAVLDKAFKAQTAHSFSTVMTNWYRNQSKFREGTITTKGKAYARPGMILMYLKPRGGRKAEYAPDLGMYYIDSVDHTYEIGAVPTTTFRVKRGVPLPLNAPELTTLLRDWEIAPPGLNIIDGLNIARGP